MHMCIHLPNNWEQSGVPVDFFRRYGNEGPTNSAFSSDGVKPTGLRPISTLQPVRSAPLHRHTYSWGTIVTDTSKRSPNLSFQLSVRRLIYINILYIPNILSRPIMCKEPIYHTDIDPGLLCIGNQYSTLI